MTFVIPYQHFFQLFRSGALRRPLRPSLTGGAILLLLFSAALGSQRPVTERERVSFGRAGVAVIAEKADTAEKRARGLMYRAALADNEAMLFYFDQSDYHGFWMRNTRMPLTVIFLDESLKIVDMQNMEPCVEKDAGRCATYNSSRPARYAIEVNQGFVGAHGIRLGDTITIEREKRR